MNKYLIRNFLYAVLLVVTAFVLNSCGSGEEHPVSRLSDLRGARIGVQLGTTNDVQASRLETKDDGTRVERFTKSADAVQALRQGKIDCMIEDLQPAKAFLRNNPTLRILPEVFSSSDIAVCVAQGNERLLADINRAIVQLKNDGTIDSIVARHIDRGMAVAYHSKLSAETPRKGTLSFSTNAAFEPFEYYSNGNIVGIDIDVARAVCDCLDMDLKIVDMEFDAVITSVQTGKADAAISGLTITEERKKNVHFSVPYTDVKQVVIVRTGEVVSEGLSIMEKFRACFVTGQRYQYLLKGLGNTLVITFFALLLSLALGTIIAIVRSTHERNGNLRLLNFLCQIYLSVIRGTPSMVQLLIIYYVVFASADVNKVVVAITAFGLNSAAYMAEVVRSGIMSVNQGQMEAGRSLGLSYAQTMRFVILPQAFKNVLPAMGNECITLLKETSISGYIGLVDLTKGSDIIRSVTYDAMMPLGMVAIIYLLLVLALSAGVSRIEKRLAKTK